MLRRLEIPFSLIQHSGDPKIPLVLVAVVPDLQWENNVSGDLNIFVKMSGFIAWLKVAQFSK